MRIIIKILTAIGNQNLNNILKKENEFEILKEDIFYKEGILEFLEKNKNIDILILYEKLYGEITIQDLIQNIKKINNEIIIFFILENKNEEIENILKKENIKNIFYNEEIDINKFIINLKNAKINNEEKLEKEIQILKNIIQKKDEQLLKYKKNNLEKFDNRKLIIIIGEENVGKSLILSNLKNIINENDLFEFKEININNYEEIEKIKNITYKFIFICEINLEKIKKNKKNINKLIFENKIDKKNIYIIFNKIDKYSINIKIAKNIFKQFKIIGNIKLNNYSDFLLNKNNNYKKENDKLKRQYLKIINKI